MRVLITCFAHNTHYHPLVPLAWALRAAGHEVRVASQPALTEVVNGSGLTAQPVGDLDSITELMTQIAGDPTPYQRGLDFAETRHLPYGWEHALGQQTMMTAMSFAPLNGDTTIDDLVDVARSWRPDLIVWEPFTYAGAIAAHVTGTPHARVLWGPDVVLNARGQFLDLMSRQPAERREDPMAEWLTWTLERHGITPDAAAIENIVTADWTVDPAPASLRLPAVGDVLPMRYVPYNGPSVVPDWLRTPPDRPRVCLTLGVSARETFGRDAVPFEDLLHALGDVDAEIVATLDAAQLADRDALPANIRVVDFVPLDALLPSCAAIVHHGGAGTHSTATLHGVPQIIVGALWDAPLKALLHAEAGAGIDLPPDKLDTDTLRAAIIRAVEDPALAAGARRLREQALADPSPAAVVTRLEHLTAAHRDRHRTAPRRRGESQ
ncbi:activator-dependent family glycosyltransferase [Streptomyces albogriseolus]|uniref:activator-dependent family glycosyltransferase n=1 Tax=Streptomyces TaxID=1883 RepID=UPI002A7569FD|nr:activator-dependent family glycosyltransferase [Streptomyces sp. CL7]WPP34391.1 activator-dependent family glycosyltransferase [Streptomyces sp. CL7]